MASSRYPDQKEITTLFESLSNGNAEAFFSRVSPTVDWELLGQHPLAGRFRNLADWKKGALEPINKVLREPLKLQVRNVVGGGEQEWASVELFADAVCINGSLPYVLKILWLWLWHHCTKPHCIAVIVRLKIHFWLIVFPKVWIIRNDTAG